MGRIIDGRESVLWHALGFGLGGVLTSVGLYMLLIVESSLSPSLQNVAVFGPFAVGGAFGGAFSAARNPAPPSGFRSGVCFGLGFLLAGPIVVFSMISLQGGVEPFYAAVSWGLGFGASGLAGAALATGRFWGVRTWKAGLGFLVGGAVGGPIAFHTFSATGSALALAGGLTGAFSIGGGLLGLTNGFRDSPST